MGDDVAKEAEGPGLEPSVLERSEEFDGAFGEMARLLRTTGVEIGFPQSEQRCAEEPIGGDLLQSLLEQG